MGATIPRIDIGPLFDGPSSSRLAVERAIMAAAAEHGFMTVTGLPAAIPLDAATRRDILRIFSLPVTVQRTLWRRKFDQRRSNVYRGWFPRQADTVTFKEGIDLGPDCAHGGTVVDPTDPLREATPLPAEADLPGWRASVRRYYLGMEHTGQVLMRAIARGLGLEEATFDAAFAGGISTLRLIHYPPRAPAALALIKDPELWVEHEGARALVSGKAHVDSGFLTLLAQHCVAGLQARALDGRWVDVPPEEGRLAINFGKVLERWTGGRMRATEHRVISTGERSRHSIPFFYEPAVDACIAPLPIEGAASFEPFSYGDHLWSAMTRFVEFKGLGSLRPPREARADAPCSLAP